MDIESLRCNFSFGFDFILGNISLICRLLELQLIYRLFFVVEMAAITNFNDRMERELCTLVVIIYSITIPTIII